VINLKTPRRRLEASRLAAGTGGSFIDDGRSRWAEVVAQTGAKAPRQFQIERAAYPSERDGSYTKLVTRLSHFR